MNSNRFQMNIARAENYCSQFRDNDFRLITGLQKYVFIKIYCKYCGPKTPIPNPHALFMLFHFYRNYPARTEYEVAYYMKYDTVMYERNIRKYEDYLASVIDELNKPFQQRISPNNRLPRIFPSNITGAIDTFPIRIYRPKKKLLVKATMNPKYKSCVLKVQVMVDHTGNIIWFSGPHLGTISDIELWRRYKPKNKLYNNELFLADKAYIGSQDCITEIKKYKSRDLTDVQKAWNRIIQWYRSSVEHGIGYVKRFKILSDKYRGRLEKDEEAITRLGKIVKICIHASTIHTSLNPHRVPQLNYA